MTADRLISHSYYEAALLRSLNFFLDIGADSTFPSDVDVQYSYRRTTTDHSQYIHRSGTLLVAILGGAEGFAFMPNRIFTSHSEGLTPDDVIVKLVGLCRNTDALEKLWAKTKSEMEGERELSVVAEES